MPWISRNSSLTQSEMENNANIVIAYYRSIGVEDRTIAAILANMQAESTINPERYEGGVGPGYGLCQWTPITSLQNACTTMGLSPYTSGDVQLQVLKGQIIGIPAGVNSWYTSSAFISHYYNSGATYDMIGITGQQFLSNSMNWEPDKLAVMFMAGYERPSYNPSINHYTQRMQNALDWYSYMGGQPSGTYTPRLDDNGIVGNFHYYSDNIFYQSGYGMPNCTAYAWRAFL